MVIRVSGCKDPTIKEEIYCVSSLWLFCAARLICKRMRDMLLSNNDLHRCKNPTAMCKCAKFLLMVSGYNKRKELERVNNNMTVFKICLI